MSWLKLFSRQYKPLSRVARTVMVLNSKGGSGKTTVATNLAAYFAGKGHRVLLADFDPQRSSLMWLAARPEHAEKIHGLAADREPLWIPQEVDTVIMDVPAGIRPRQLNYLLRHVQTVLVPVLPSPLDMRAATDFVESLLRADKVMHLRTKVAFVANRVREHTRAYESLNDFLQEWDIPVLTHLRDSANYLNAADRGLGVFELGSTAEIDIEQWQPLVKWLRTKASKPLTTD